VILGEAGTDRCRGASIRNGHRIIVRCGVAQRLLKQQCDQLSPAAEPLEGHSLSLADSATDEFDHDLALGSFRGTNALFEIDEALKRILTGTYGVSRKRQTDRQTAFAGIPWTRFLKEVAARLENEGAVKGSFGHARFVREHQEI
jgi:hypothetical protein